MQVVAGLISLLKRGRTAEASSSEGSEPASESCGGSQEDVQRRLCAQLCLAEAGKPGASGSSAAKKRRMSAPAVAPTAALPLPLGAFNLKGNALFGGSSLAYNPLYSEDDEDEAAAYEPISSASTRSIGLGSLSGSSSDQENAPLPALPRLAGGAGGSSTHQEGGDLLAELACCGAGTNVGNSSELAVFLSQLLSKPVLAALTALQRFDLHPVGPGTLQTTIAGLLVLCRRATLASEELTPEALLTMLWLLESAGSQYRSSLPTCLRDWLELLPHGKQLFKPLKARILSLQLLERCGWRVVLRDSSELHAACSELEACPSFNRICALVERWGAADGLLPLGSPWQGVLGTAGGSCAAEQPSAGPAERRGSRPASAAVGRVLAPLNW